MLKIAFDENLTIEIFNSNVQDLYDEWAAPIVIVSDGAYGVSGFPGDLPTHEGLDEWYEPHIKAWSKKATPQTTLWFWNTEIGWATVHPVLIKYGWEYKACHIWDKGIAHIAGNSNTRSLRQLPIVTEICAQYIKKAYFQIGDQQLAMQEWLRHEWERTGLPLYKTNEACGVKNAASRKYFTKDHLWYYPPPEAFEQIVNYANAFGNPAGRPYFSIDGKNSLAREEWEKYRAKFYCPVGVTNVWQESPVNGDERIKAGTKALHLNQKPLSLTELIISISSDKHDLIWEPFGGLCTTAVASYNLRRSCVAAETDRKIYQEAAKRLLSHSQQIRLF
ncbi:MAG: site-specific DNA-methyltransferase [Anaerolineae bacterium]|nr:site-specific DNA-methyltransferase [Anaerolineae bacterium]